MVGVLSLGGLFLGAALAGAAERWPAHTVMLERAAGTLMTAALAAIGLFLPFFP
jgi:hypothetical protein